MKNDPCSAKHRMPFLQIFADQLSQTAASLPGANVKHPSSAAVWAYAHLDKKGTHLVKMKRSNFYQVWEYFLGSGPDFISRLMFFVVVRVSLGSSTQNHTESYANSADK